ncbi:acyl-CoA thioesterase [Permianibacter fluminis]|uniref:acyl-CoA thioesterase n=1 Tax=Permianibacter fluminis TaxID=2738515 RepID=UPI001B7D8730|nr:thioesterase family protein [Permianibacter fluminis]
MTSIHSMPPSAVQTERPDALRGYPVLLPVTVAWGEMDAFQHVNNVVYFRYFESARIEYGRLVHLLDDKETSGIGPILAATNARYKRPVLFPDQLLIGVTVSRIGSDRFWQNYRIYSVNQQAITTEGEAEIVLFDYRNQRKAAVPAELRQRMEALEQRPLVDA